MSQYLVSDFSRVAHIYDQYAGFQNEVVERLVKQSRHVSETFGSILDVGSGTGAIAKAMQNSAEYIMQLDASPEMCEIAEEFGLTMVGNAEDMPFSDNSFDAVFSSMMLQWVDLPGKVFKEIFRVLKPGGYMFMALPVLGSCMELHGALSRAGRAQSMRSFAHGEDVLRYVEESELSIVNAEVKATVEEFESIKDMLDSIRRIGGSNKNSYRNEPFTKEQWRRFNAFYRNEVSITWNILYIIAKKQ